MCGIIGMINGKSVKPYLLEGLRLLEYRGYDSAGMAVLDKEIQIRKTKGRIIELEKALKKEPVKGTAGIAHTRWATHGDPVQKNAHPHQYHNVAVVHNGIIENYKELRQKLQDANHDFISDTDTEVIPHLIAEYIKFGWNLVEAVRHVMPCLKGSFAIGVMCEEYPNSMVVARQGSPLVVGKASGTGSFSSDAAVLTDIADAIAFLDDGEIADVQRENVIVYDENGKAKTVLWEKVIRNSTDTELLGFQHYTAKEIAQQPEVLERTLDSMRNQHIQEKFTDISRILIIGCGSSYFAGQLAKDWFENIAHIPVDIEMASEFRYKIPLLDKKTLVIGISQSGETADTLAAIGYAKSEGLQTVALTNVKHSQIARIADHVWPLEVGAEMGVAATKSFTAQVVALAYAAIQMAHGSKDVVDDTVVSELRDLMQLPSLIEDMFFIAQYFKRLSLEMREKRSCLFIGRGSSYAAAQEAALKLKELSYIQAEAYAAGELKHGPLALIEEGLPVFVFAPQGITFSKTMANAQEAAARGAELFIITNESTPQEELPDDASIIRIPDCSERLSAILEVVAGQFLAYHTALAKGLDVDKPRNLAKSVTVE